MESPLMLRERSRPTLIANQTRWVSLAQLAAGLCCQGGGSDAARL